MKKFLFYVVLILVVGTAGALTAVYFITKKNAQPEPVVTHPSKLIYKDVDACVALSGEDAVALLNDTVTGGSSANGSASSPDITVTNCSYKAAASAKSVGIVARSAKSLAGVVGNKGAFGINKPVNAVAVTGLGDAAFWSPDYAQLNLLVGNNWYIITSGLPTAASRTVDDAKAVAVRILQRL